MIGLQKHSQKSDIFPVLRALQSSKLINCNPDEVKKLVLYICAVLGMEEQTQSSILASYQYLHNNRKAYRYTIEEARLAFEMAADFNLDKVSKKIISPYLIGRVLKEYEKHKRDEIRRAKSHRDKEPEPKKVATEKDHESAYNYVTDYILKHEKVPEFGLWLFIYKHMKLHKMGWYSDKISHSERNEMKLDFRKKVESSLMAKKKSITKNIESEFAARTLSDEELIRKECRSEYVIKYFKEII